MSQSTIEKVRAYQAMYMATWLKLEKLIATNMDRIHNPELMKELITEEFKEQKDEQNTEETEITQE